MAKKPIQVRIDEKLKKQVEEIFEHIGIDTPTAIRMFFAKVALTGGIPFRLHEDLPDSAFFTDEEIEEAYRESLDAKNLVGPFKSIDGAVRRLKRR